GYVFEETRLTGGDHPVGERTRLGLGVLGAALVLGVLGDLLLRATPWGINVFLWIAGLVGSVAVLAAWRGIGLRGEGRWLVVPLLLFSAFFAWRDSNTLAVVNGLAVLVALSLAALRTRSGRLVIAGLADYFYWGLQAVGYAYAGMFPAATQDVHWRELRVGGYGTLLAILRGLAIASPLLLLFGGLFVAADAVFERLVLNLFDFDPARVLGHLLLFFAIAWASAGLLRLALIGGELPKPEGRPSFAYLGVVELGVALGLLNVLFLTFVVVQVRYLFGGEDQVLASAGLTYAEYARRGFFELVGVTALVLPLLLLAHWLLRAERPAHEKVLRLFSGSLVALLFVVMDSALQRMRLYQAEFGLTELRLYTTAFMFWIFAVLVWFLLTVLRGRRERFAFGALTTGFLAVALVNAINPDALIVRTNVARLEAGREFDAPYLASLSADAVPSLMESLAAMNGDDRLAVEEVLRRRWASAAGEGWRTYNIGRSQARDAVDTGLSGYPVMASRAGSVKGRSRTRACWGNT
ncbi:MAG: DUF4173 domain-containing protein, partial [Actinomycetota bacterium]|nr:DUF4173 domain-containing protein [Actinomycetota bacterium]